MQQIRGVSVSLTVRTLTGYDALNCPTYSETSAQVDNVLIAPVSGEEAVETVNLTGRRAVYTLHIPKEDTHEWEDTTVSFWGEVWRTIGAPVEYLEQNTPGPWNRSIRVERYES